MRRALVCVVAPSHAKPEPAKSFRAEVTAATAAGEPVLDHSARRTACCKALSRSAQYIRRPTQARPLEIRPTLLHSPCRWSTTLLDPAALTASGKQSKSLCLSAGLIGRYRRPIARPASAARSSRERSGSSLRVTTVRRGTYGCLKERSERSERHLRGWDRRTGDQAHRGRCPADPSRPWGRLAGSRGAID